MARLTQEVQTIGPSPLVGVVPVAMTVDTAGVIVDLLAIEVRELGAILYWRARSSREVLLLSAKVSMSDDRGTPYRVTEAGGGGDGHTWQGQTFALPAPPRRARLGVVLESFGPSADMPLPPHLPTERVPGPWSFEVEVNLG